MPEVVPNASPAATPSAPASKAISIPRPAGVRTARAATSSAPQHHESTPAAKTGPVTSSAPVTETPKPDAAAIEAKKPTTEVPQNGTTPENTTEQPKPQLHKVKVGGVEREVSTEDLIRAFSKGETADEKFRQASELQKQTQAETAKNRAFAAVLKDPAKFAAEIDAHAAKSGFDKRALGEALLAPEIERQVREAELAAMTPEQRKVYDMEQKLKEYEQKELQSKTQQEVEAKKVSEAKKEAEVTAWRQQYEPLMIQALEKVGLPKSRELGIEMIQLHKAAIARGESVTPDQLAQDLVARKRAEWNTTVKATGNLDYVSPEVRELIRKQAIEEHLKSHPMANAEPITRGTKKPAMAEERTGTFSGLQRDLVMHRRTPKTVSR